MSVAPSPTAGGVLVPSAEMIVLGKVAAASGLKGEVRVFPFADDPVAWSRMPFWWVGREGDAGPLWHQTKLNRCQVRNDLLIAQLACATDRTAAEALRGLLVGAPRDALPATDTDEYYWADLIGLEVITSRGQSLGRIAGLIETPANAVLRVDDGESAERLLPFVAAVVLTVDLPQRRVVVQWEADW